MVEMKNLLGIEDLTTAAYSSWQNGLCEKEHQMIEAIKRDHQDYPIDVLLIWACMAKNTMYDHYGFRPNQLVLGMNPRLPNVLTEGSPEMEGRKHSEILAQHMNALQAARRAFTAKETSEKVRLALKKNSGLRYTTRMIKSTGNTRMRIDGGGQEECDITTGR